MRFGSGRDVFRIAGPAVAAVLAAFYIAFLFVEPAPPDRIVLATGGKAGAYHHFGQRYRTLLAEDDVTVELRSTSGSIENLRLLKSADSDVDVAFVQGGMVHGGARSDLQALASLYFEPLWVFTRKPLDIARLTELKGRRIAAGVEGSGTWELARSLLSANGLLDPAEAARAPTDVLSLGGAEAAEALREGRVDAAFFVAGASSGLVSDLLRSPELQLMSFARAQGYAQARPELSTVTLHEGAIDFGAGIPPVETRLLAPAASLIARQDLHPALAELLLRAATRSHAEGGLFEPPGTFPSARFLDFPLSEDAQRYLERGPSFLDRYLPFWAANLVERMLVMLIPLVTLLLPLIRFLPPVYRWRIRSRIYRWYKELRAIDGATRAAIPQAEFDRLAGELDRIEEEVKQVSVPLSYAEPLYHLRLHIELLRDKLMEPTARRGPAILPQQGRS